MSNIQSVIDDTNDRIDRIDDDIQLRETLISTLKNRKELLRSSVQHLTDIQMSLEALDSAPYTEENQQLDATVAITQT